MNDTNNDLSSTFDDGSSGGDDSSRTMSGSNNKIQTMRPLVPLRVIFSPYPFRVTCPFIH